HYRYHCTRLLEPVDGAVAKSLEVRAGKATCEAKVASPGSYVLRLRDPKTGSLTTHAFYVGYGAWEDSVSRENPEKLQLVIQRAGGPGKMSEAMRRLDLAGAIEAAGREPDRGER